MVDRKRVKITDPLAIYSGCYIRASINIYTFNANGNRGIAAGSVSYTHLDILFLKVIY